MWVLCDREPVRERPPDLIQCAHRRGAYLRSLARERHDCGSEHKTQRPQECNCSFAGPNFVFLLLATLQIGILDRSVEID
jgi:hypothetical protein